MAHNFININYTSVIGAAFLTVFLMFNCDLEKSIKRIFYALIGLQMVEMIAFTLELIYASADTFQMPLVFWSGVGYSVRPMMLFLVLELVLRNDSRFRLYRRILFVLLILNIVMAFSAFFTDIMYSYDSENNFVRGPLGYFPHAILICYQIFLAVFTIRNRRRVIFESFMVLVILALISFSMIVEIIEYTIGIGRSTIILSIIFYYMYFQSQVYRDTRTAESVLLENLEQENRKDALTGLLNKKYFEQQSRSVLESRYKGSFGFMLMDLDYFKEVNDRLGHAVGDEVLIEVGTILKQLFRKGDAVARFGGDEFCVFINDISKEAIIKQMENMLHVLRREYKNEKHTVKISASIGAVYCSGNPSCSDYHLLFEIADRALYEAKKDGRDRYILKEI